MTTTVCRHCDKRFTLSRHSNRFRGAGGSAIKATRYCSPKCRQAAYRKRPATNVARAVTRPLQHIEIAKESSAVLTTPDPRPIPGEALILTLGEEIRHRGIWDVWHGGRVLCRSDTPLLDGARVLLAEGAPPQTTIVLMRDGVESLRSRLGYAAALRVKECADGVPRFATYVPYPTTDEDALHHSIATAGRRGAPLLRRRNPNE